MGIAIKPPSIVDERRAWVKKFGSYNDFPRNWKRIPERDFWHRFSMYGLGERQEDRQMMKPPTTLRRTCKELKRVVSYIEAKLFFYSDDSGLAMVRNYNRDTGYGPPFTYEFAACKHDMQKIRAESRMCYTVSRCTKCGYKQSVDSSG